MHMVHLHSVTLDCIKFSKKILLIFWHGFWLLWFLVYFLLGFFVGILGFGCLLVGFFFKYLDYILVKLELREKVIQILLPRFFAA